MRLFLTDGLVSYSIPKGVQRGLEIDLSDQTYDGHDENDRLVDGLGQLVDGQRGTDNFRTDIHGYGKGMFNTQNILPFSSSSPSAPPLSKKSILLLPVHTINKFPNQHLILKHEQSKIFREKYGKQSQIPL